MSSWIVYATVVGLAFFSGKATADEEIKCACSPSTYEFTLDFSLTCPPVNVTLNDGIAATFCQISPFGEPDEKIADLVPVDVDYIDVLELGQGFSVITQKNITGPFADGDTFEYTSLTAGGDNVEVPRVLQLNIFAFNAAGEAIVNFYAISFTNNCDEFPVLIEGGSAGWTRFTRLESPSAALCPAAAVQTDPPTILTSTLPPVDTEPPVGPPTEPPTSFTTTEPPVDPPTGPPAGPMVDTDPPTSFMSMDMSMGMVSAGDIMMDLAMSMDMSMSMAAESRLAFLRVAETKGAKSDKKSKKEKSEKSGKSDKKTKSDKKEKYDKSAKSDKKAKSDKEEKSAKEAKSGKKEKSDKKAKSDKKEKSEKRRLRIRPLFEAQ